MVEERRKVSRFGQALVCFFLGYTMGACRLLHHLFVWWDSKRVKAAIFHHIGSVGRSLVKEAWVIGCGSQLLGGFSLGPSCYHSWVFGQGQLRTGCRLSVCCSMLHCQPVGQSKLYWKSTFVTSGRSFQSLERLLGRNFGIVVDCVDFFEDMQIRCTL